MLAPAVAGAQAARPIGALDRLDPAPAGDGFFSIPTADVPGRLRFYGELAFSYAHDPLELRSISGTLGPPVAWVSHQAVLHALVGVDLARRIKLDVDAPFYLSESGASGSLGGVSVTTPPGAAVGDLRFGARALLLRQDGFVPAAAIAFSIWAPAGNAGSFTGSGAVRYQPSVILSAEHAHLVWSASVGARVQPSSSEALIGSQIVGGLGVAARWAGFQVGPELFYGVGAGDQIAKLVSKSSTFGGEALLSARYTSRLGWIGAGGGPGLGLGPGTPVYRIFFTLGASLDALPVEAPAEAKGSTGVKGKADAAEVPGDKTSPTGPTPAAPVVSDIDGDGVPDAEDACPTIVGDATPGAYRRGCPPDRDRDGIFDADDACPDVPGVASVDPKKNGCPLDSDGDGIPDAEDACPNEKGKPNADPKLNGCPEAVRVEGTQIVILQQVNFETAIDEIKADSFGLLGQVAAVLKEHPEIARLAVDGHTDNIGSEKANVNLSERRAVAVVRWLTEHGIDARRLESRGLGPRRPIADNKTDAGRAKNRRVEFQIRRRTTEGEAGWRDGPIPMVDEAAK